jgi:hypothetical protein
VRLDPLLTGRGLEVDDLLYAANRVCPMWEQQLVGDGNVSAKCHDIRSYVISNSQKQPTLLLTAIAVKSS